MADQPISWAGARVVKASHELTSGQKLVWLEIHGLDRGAARCWMSASGLARRLGMGIENVEKARRDLKAIGLLGSAQLPRRGAARTASWWVELPQCAQPRSRSPADEEIASLADELDGWIRVRRADAPDGVPQSAMRPSLRGVPQYADPPPGHGVPQSASKAHRRPQDGVPQYAPGEGGKGGGASILKPYVNTAPSSASVREDGEDGREDRGEDGTAEDGARSRARCEDGVRPSLAPGNWREILTQAGGRPPPPVPPDP